MNQKKPLTKKEALNLLTTHVENINLQKHCRAVGFALTEYFDYYKKHGRDTGSLTREQWEIIGIIHDTDWEETASAPETHTLKLLEWLKEYDVPEEMRDVIESHNSQLKGTRKPQTLLEWTLETCDELTGFIVAVALVMPNKRLADVTVKRVLKKMKQKEFARAVHREQITQCETTVNIPLDEFIGITLNAMQKNSDVLGL